MKKSIIRVLTAVLVVCGVGFISSCKDYDDNLSDELQSSGIGIIDGTIQEEINKELEDLKEQKDDLAAIIDSLKNLKHCDCNMGDITASINQAIADALAQYEATHPDTDTDTNFITEQEWIDIQKAIDEAIKAALKKYEETHPDTDTDTKPDYDKIQQMINNAIKDFKSCTCDPNATSCTCDPNKGNCTCDPNKGNCTCDPNKGNCTCDPNKVSCTCEVKTKKDIQDMISKAITDALASYYTSAQIDEMLKKYALKSDIADMATKTWVTEQINAIKACTTCEEAIKKINERIAEAEKVLEQHGNDIKALYEQYTSLELFIGEVNSLANRAFQAAQNAQKAAEAAQSLAESAMATAQHADQLAQEVADNLETLTNTVNLMGIKLAVLKERVEKINTRLIGVEEQMVEIYQKALDAYTQANKNKEDIQDIKNTYTLLSDHNALVDTVANHYTELLNLINQRVSQEQLDEAKAEAVRNLDFVREYLEGVIGAVAETLEIAVNDIDVLKSDVSTLQNWVNTTGAQLVIDVESLKTRMTEAEAAIDQNAQDIAQNASDIAALQQELLRIDALEKNLNSLVTSIEIQQTSNPLFGSVNLPLGIQTNVLALWYGEAMTSGTFPSYGKNAPYIWDSQAMMTYEKSIAGAPKNDYYEYDGGDMLYDDSEGNAGTIYMTVNPSNVDFTGTQFSLVNSLDEESAFKLGALQPSNHLIQHGITRSAANGLYQAPVTLNEANIYDVNIDVADGLLSSVKNVLSNVTTPSDINVSKVASTVKDQLTNLKTDALGLKAHCTDPDRSVYSQYALAGVAIKNPINYGTFKSLGLNNVKSVPGYERAINMINSVSKTVKSKVKFNIGGKLIDDINAIKIQHISIPELSDAQKAKFNVSIDTTIYINDLKYHLDLTKEVEVPVKFEKDLTIPVNNITASVSVPVNIEKEVSVDLQNVSVSSPTVVVTGTASGTANTTDEYGNLTSILVVPVKNDVGDIVGYANVPLNDINVQADINAEGGLKDGSTIKLNGTPVAKVEIHDTFTGTGQASGQVEYHLVVDETVKTKVNIEEWFYFGDEDEYGNKTDKKTVRIQITRDFSGAIEDIWGTVQGSMGDVNDMLDQLQKVVDDANDLFDQINSVDKKITGVIDQVTDQLKSFIDRINNKIVSIINSAESRLQPILIGSDSQTRLLSRAISQPSRINSSIDLYATNYLGEVVAPAFKKHIAVTNVYKADGSVASNAKALADAVNASADMNKVLKGKQIKVSVSGFQAGYIYEVAFSALDYTGKQVTHKYYVRVK